MTIPIIGGCACGAVRYQCNAEPIAMLNCHCKDCQRSSGAPYASGFIVTPSAMEISGEVAAHSVVGGSGAKTTRNFCSICGSPLFASTEVSPAFMSVRFSTLDSTADFEPKLDIWTSSAQPWTCMNSLSPKFEQSPM
ncbi:MULTISPECIES: GFA family protein [unclassified Microcoleus]|uniref:GFA family protein n=1 Tax=unclassified Microcoleus TaxID=2642155 RepID=UPI002FD5EAB3